MYETELQLIQSKFPLVQHASYRYGTVTLHTRTLFLPACGKLYRIGRLRITYRPSTGRITVMNETMSMLWSRIVACVHPYVYGSYTAPHICWGNDVGQRIREIAESGDVLMTLHMLLTWLQADCTKLEREHKWDGGYVSKWPQATPDEVARYIAQGGTLDGSA